MQDPIDNSTVYSRVILGKYSNYYYFLLSRNCHESGSRFSTNLNKFIRSTFSNTQKSKMTYLVVSKQVNKTKRKQQRLDTNDDKKNWNKKETRWISVTDLLLVSKPLLTLRVHVTILVWQLGTWYSVELSRVQMHWICPLYKLSTCWAQKVERIWTSCWEVLSAVIHAWLNKVECICTATLNVLSPCTRSA